MESIRGLILLQGGSNGSRGAEAPPEPPHFNHCIRATEETILDFDVVMRIILHRVRVRVGLGLRLGHIPRVTVCVISGVC